MRHRRHLVWQQQGANRFLFLHLSNCQAHALGSGTKKTVIFEAELIAFVAAIILWRDRIVNRSLVAFVDNNSVRDVCISGKARNAMGHQLVTLLLAVEDLAGLNTWIARVPSPSNPSDILSREDTEILSGRKRIKASSVEKTIKAILE